MDWGHHSWSLATLLTKVRVDGETSSWTCRTTPVPHVLVFFFGVVGWGANVILVSAQVLLVLTLGLRTRAWQYPMQSTLCVLSVCQRGKNFAFDIRSEIDPSYMGYLKLLCWCDVVLLMLSSTGWVGQHLCPIMLTVATASLSRHPAMTTPSAPSPDRTSPRACQEVRTPPFCDQPPSKKFLGLTTI